MNVQDYLTEKHLQNDNADALQKFLRRDLPWKIASQTNRS